MDKTKGQVMILTVLALGGTILGATAIAGTLMLYQLRQAKDIESSTEAIYYADAGIECGLNYFFNALQSAGQSGNSPAFSKITSSCSNKNDINKSNIYVVFDCSANGCSSATPTAITSIGSSANGNVRRAFYISVQSTSTVLTIPQ